MTDRLDELFWAACIGCALWGVLITAVCALIIAAVVRVYCRDRREESKRERRARDVRGL